MGWGVSGLVQSVEGGNAYNNAGNYGTGVANKLGFGQQKQDSLAQQQAATGNQQYQSTEGVLAGQKTADQQYQDSSTAAASKYETASDMNEAAWKNKADTLDQESQTQATNAQNVYNATIEPNQKNVMEDASKSAGEAMSLSDAEDPNNAVASGVRNMYNQQAQGVQNQGVADYGVLAALGSQATAGTMGSGMPMTGGQLASIQGQNMSGASGAYNQAAQNAQGLRTQGITAGINQSNTMYQAGQNAIGLYGQATDNYQQGLNSNNQQQQNFRNEQGNINNQVLNADQGIAGQQYGISNQLAGQQLGFSQNQAQNELAAQGQNFGTTQASLGSQMNAEGAGQAAKIGFNSAMGSQVASLFGGGGSSVNPSTGTSAEQMPQQQSGSGEAAGQGVGNQMASEGYSANGPYAGAYGTGSGNEQGAEGNNVYAGSYTAGDQNNNGGNGNQNNGNSGVGGYMSGYGFGS